MPEALNLRPFPAASTVIVITAKAPVPGRAKTRLAPALTPAQAAALHRALLIDTINLVKSLPHVDVAVICPKGDREALAGTVPDGIVIVEQRDEGLAAALTDVFERFTSQGYARVLAFDSDSPHIPAASLRAAVEALVHADLVIGPTRDGGYYLVGARASHPNLFAGALGTKDALHALLDRARELALVTWLSDEWYDIDRAEDLAELRATLRDEPGRAPATAALFESWDGVGPERTRTPGGRGPGIR